MDRCLHTHIVESVRDTATAVILALEPDLDSKVSFTDDFILRKMFKNYRVIRGKRHGLRLSFIGHMTMKDSFEFYAYENPERLSNEILLGLDNNMVWPYYISKNFIIFYNDIDAAWFKLSNGDLTEYKGYI